MVWGLGRHKVVPTLNGGFAAVVGIRRRALTLFTAIRSLLIELSASEAVERPNEQKDCKEGDGNVNASTHSAPE
jgi:hypothetical protein